MRKTEVNILSYLKRSKNDYYGKKYKGFKGAGMREDGHITAASKRKLYSMVQGYMLSKMFQGKKKSEEDKN